MNWVAALYKATPMPFRQPRTRRFHNKIKRLLDPCTEPYLTTPFSYRSFRPSTAKICRAVHGLPFRWGFPSAFIRRAISEAPPVLASLKYPVNGEVPPVKGRPRKLPHYANRGKTSSSGGELASARSCFSTVRTALGKLRITGLLAQFDIARSFPQFPRPLLLQPTILTSERGTRFGIRKAPNHVPPPHLPDDP